MANTVSNLMYITGSLAERDQLVGGIIRAGGSQHMLDAHVSDAWMSLGADGPDSRAYISDVAPSHTDGYTAFRFSSYGAAHCTWLRSVAAVFPCLTFELLTGSVMDFVAYSRYENGREVVDEVVPDWEATPFCARHGWPGWWVPMYDEALDPWADRSADLPTISDVEGAGPETPASRIALPTTLEFPSEEVLVVRDTEYPVQKW